MVKLSGLQTKLCAINQARQLAHTLYLYIDSAYSTIYGIIGPYKNYPNCLKTTAYNHFNNTIFKFHIKVKYDFVLYQNL